MAEKVSVSDILISWLLFWFLTLLGMALLAGCILVPLRQEQYRLLREYQATELQIAQIEAQVIRSRERLSAIWVDPQYTERIARNELNLRKSGEEIIYIEPIYFYDELQSDTGKLSFTLPTDYSDRWWYSMFLDEKHRRWYLIFAGGFIATAIITAVALKDRRKSQLIS